MSSATNSPGLERPRPIFRESGTTGQQNVPPIVRRVNEAPLRAMKRVVGKEAGGGGRLQTDNVNGDRILYFRMIFLSQKPQRKMEAKLFFCLNLGSSPGASL